MMKWMIKTLSENCVHMHPVKQTSAIGFPCIHRENESEICSFDDCPIKQATPQSMRDEEIEEAYETIKEWGVHADNFVAQNTKMSMFGGTPSDNSIELYDFFITQLESVVKIGLATIEKEYSLPLKHGLTGGGNR